MTDDAQSAAGHAAPPSSDVARMMMALPGGVALFDATGVLLEANPPFLAALGSHAVPGRFETLFRADPAMFANGRGEAVQLNGRHYALVTRAVDGWGWLCQLQDVTAWLSGHAAAKETGERDALTGLPNRDIIVRAVERALRGGDPCALLKIDLDRFVRINDAVGDSAGDALLGKVAQRLEASVRPSDVAARLGGGKFAVLQTDMAQPLGASTLAERLVEVLARPYVVDGHMIDVGISIGVATRDAGVDTRALFKRADVALRRAKSAGRSRYTFFEPRMDEEVQERRALEADLRRALAFRQFELHYQPQLDLATHTVTGMEALIRWRHPARGLVPPAAFITIAEETGLIVPIGEWVIRQALDDAAGWPGALTVAVNVSVKQLASGKLVGVVAQAIAAAGLEPSRVELEVTESVLMSDVDGCVATLHKLRALGVRVSMDDFGTGYSSLSYLSSFPFDKIKIDQSFTRSDDRGRSEGIIRAVAAIGKHLGMATIAEGVETREQMDDIAASGCGSAQGYFISEPVPADAVAGLLSRLNATPMLPDRAEAVQPVPLSIVDPNAPSTGRALPDDVVVPIGDAELYRLVYYSRNAILGVDEEVRDAVASILASSQRNNAQVGVTGALMFTDGFFAQVLEGRRHAVEEVFERVQLDDRHAEVQLLSFEPVATRLFATWAMAFVGQAEAGHEKFGHYAATSGFDFAAADGDLIVSQLRLLLVDEEKLAARAA